MVDEFKAQPFEERKSQRVGVHGYVKEVLIGFAPLMTAAAAIGFGVLTKQKIMPLDGSPDILTKCWGFAFKKGSKVTTGTELIMKDTDWHPWFTALFSTEESQVKYTKWLFNGVKGLEAGSIPLAYHVWRKREAQRLDIAPIADRLKNLNELKPSDAELAEENASLKKQVQFVEAHGNSASPVSISSARHDGKLEQKSLELQA